MAALTVGLVNENIFGFPSCKPSDSLLSVGEWKAEAWVVDTLYQNRRKCRKLIIDGLKQSVVGVLIRDAVARLNHTDELQRSLIANDSRERDSRVDVGVKR